MEIICFPFERVIEINSFILATEAGMQGEVDIPNLQGALTQAEPPVREVLYDVSWYFRERKRYCDTLEQTQKGEMEITAWLKWFLDTLNETFDAALKEVEHTIFKANGDETVDGSCKEWVST